MTDTTQANPVQVEDAPYPVSFSVDYPEKLSRWTTFFRLILVVPIWLWSIFVYMHFSPFGLVVHDHKVKAAHSLNALTHKIAAHFSSGHLFTSMLATGVYILAPVILMLLFKRKYPKWIFDFNIGFFAFIMRFRIYLLCMTDCYPNTDQAQNVHLNITYPQVGHLSRWLPFVKWFLAIPHYICLMALFAASAVLSILAWFAIIFTGRYPKTFFDFNVGVMRWFVRVSCYALLLTTDQYPPFSLS